MPRTLFGLAGAGLVFLLLGGAVLAADWQARISDYDAGRLSRIAEARAAGLAEADAGGPAGEAAHARAILSAPARAASARDLTGTWRCRTIKLGGISPVITYSWFRCAITARDGRLFFQKLTGSQRVTGYLYADGDAHVMLGAWTVNDERPIPYSGRGPAGAADHAFSDAVAVLSLTGRGQARLEFPEPVLESRFDVIELRR